ncbi:MAG: cation:proton antiporter [Spirochaetia bacterium]
MNFEVFTGFLRGVTSTHALATLGTLLIGGYLLGKLSGRVRLPEITGFILTGLLLGPGGFDVLPHLLEPAFQVLSQAALALIAFTIGAEFHWPKLKRIGVQVAVIGLIEVAAAFALVAGVMRLLGLPLPFALILGAIASATAPAATVAIVQSLRARGRYIDILYGLVALDDAGAVMIFAVSFAVAGSMLAPGAGPGAGELVLHAGLEIGLSLLGGVFLGAIIYLVANRRPDSNEALIFALGVVLLLAGLAQGLGYSLILGSMAAGAAYVNLVKGDQRLFRRIEPITPPLYALFFVIAGAELQPLVLVQPEVLVLGVGYVVARAVSKYAGVFVGSALTGVEPRIRNYLGLSMLPQAGVALGLVLLVRTSPMVGALPPDQQTYVGALVNVVLFSVLISELVGPPISRLAIIRGNAMEDTWSSSKSSTRAAARSR